MLGLMLNVMHCVAIASGIVGQAAADAFEMAPASEGSAFYMGGYIAPFDLSTHCLCTSRL